MIVCVCNALNCKAVSEAIDRGCRRVSCVHRYHGTAPQCGRCTAAIREMISVTESQERVEVIVEAKLEAVGD